MRGGGDICRQGGGLDSGDTLWLGLPVLLDF